MAEDSQLDGLPSPETEGRSGRLSASSVARGAIFATVKRAGMFKDKFVAATQAAADKVSNQARALAANMATKKDSDWSPIITTIDEMSRAMSILLENCPLSERDCELALRQALFKQGKIGKSMDTQGSTAPYIGTQPKSAATNPTVIGDVKHVGAFPSSKSPSQIRRAKTLSLTKRSAPNLLSMSGSDAVLSGGQYDVSVHIVEARNLISADSNGLSDPYAKVDIVVDTMSTVLGKTVTVMKSLNPKWNSRFQCVLHRNNPSFEVKVSVYDWDRLGKDDFLGHVSVRINCTDQEACEGYATDSWLMLEGDEIDTGEVRLITSVIHRSVGRGEWDCEPKLCRIAASSAEFDRHGSMIPKHLRREYKHYGSLLGCRDMRQLAAWGGREKPTTQADKLLKTDGLFWRGIPQSWRSELYSVGLNVEKHKEGTDPLYYKNLCNTCEGMECAVFSEIKKDIDRTAEGKRSYAATSAGAAQMTRILQAYALRNETMGFCQSLTYIVEALMLVCNDEESIFWFLVALCEDEQYCAGYFIPSMTHYKADFNLLLSLIKEEIPEVHAVFAEHEMFIAQFVMSWLLSIFTTSFPTDTALRLLDLCVFHGGSAMQVLISLSFIKMHKAELIECEDVDSASTKMKDLARAAFDPDRIVDVIQAQLATTTINSIRRAQVAHRINQELKTKENLKRRGIANLQERGKFPEDLAARLIDRFFRNSPDEDNAHMPVDYIGITCSQFCEIVTSVFGSEVVGFNFEGANPLPLVRLFENLDWSGADHMKLNNFVTTMAILNGPPLGSSSAAALKYIFTCFDLDDTQTLDKVEFHRLEDSLSTFSDTTLPHQAYPFFNDYPYIEADVFVEDPPMWLVKLVDEWVNVTTPIRAAIQESQDILDRARAPSAGARRVLCIGDRVCVDGYEGLGTVKFVGLCNSANQEDALANVGVELDYPVGDHDGTVEEHQYFETDDKRGVLVPTSKVSPARNSIVEADRICSDDSKLSWC